MYKRANHKTYTGDELMTIISLSGGDSVGPLRKRADPISQVKQKCPKTGTLTSLDKRTLPELVDVEHGRKAPLVVVHRDQLVLVEDEEAETCLFEHAVLLLLALGPFQVRGDLDGAQVRAGQHVEHGELFGVGGGEEGAVGVDADAVVSAHAVLAQVQVDGVESALVIGVDLDVSALRHLGGALHHADLLLAVHKQLVFA